MEGLDVSLEITNHVFVYGTLMSGHGNNYLFGDSTPLGRATTHKPLAMFNAGCPFLVDMCDFPGMSQYQYLSLPCRGEVFEVNDPFVLLSLDRLESEGTLYKRFLIEVNSDDGPEFVCWAYKSMDSWPIESCPLANVDPLGRYYWS